mmetsp:Transcript_5270/g.7053  ORF Transcript_5270/g.7053 Transcript_5270/m.7053 type:complete len:96 (-) Transcript_5270:502-789(-)
MHNNFIIFKLFLHNRDSICKIIHNNMAYRIQNCMIMMNIKSPFVYMFVWAVYLVTSVSLSILPYPGLIIFDSREMKERNEISLSFQMSLHFGRIR